jgi:hypothetical protein
MDDPGLIIAYSSLAVAVIWFVGGLCGLIWDGAVIVVGQRLPDGGEFGVGQDALAQLSIARPNGRDHRLVRLADQSPYRRSICGDTGSAFGLGVDEGELPQ